MEDEKRPILLGLLHLVYPASIYVYMRSDQIQNI